MDAPQRVQSLVDSFITDVPHQYIQPLEFRPGHNGKLDLSAPVVDLFNFDTAHSDEVRQSIKEACREWGAFQAINHGIPPKVLDDVMGVGRIFFDAPIADKLKYSCDPNFAASEGYGSRLLINDGEVLDWRDYFDHHTLPESRRQPSKWPDFPANYGDVIIEYSDYMKVVAEKILGFISESLSLPSSYIKEKIGEVYQNITISYYPTCPQPDLALGLQSHSDMGALTLLIQDDVGGLEVLKDGLWVPIEPKSNSLFAFVADQTEIISNGEYASCVHRALVNSKRSRISVATFHDPARTTQISPAPELVEKCGFLKYSEIIYGNYVSAWYSNRPDGKRNIDTLKRVTD